MLNCTELMTNQKFGLSRRANFLLELNFKEE